MPGKKKVVDPEVLKRQFAEWQISDEKKAWENMRDLKKDLPDITLAMGYSDLYGPFQPFLNEFYTFATKIMKVKAGKLKELK